MDRLAGWCYDHRGTVVLLWIVALVAFLGLGIGFGGKYATDFSVPEFESQQAYDLLRERFPEQAGDSALVVIKAPGGVRQSQARIEQVHAAFDAVEHVNGVSSPFADPSGRTISADGTIVYADLTFDIKAYSVTIETAQELVDVAERESKDGVQVELGGFVIQALSQEQPGAAEGIGVLAAMVILVITFGSLLAMALPLLCALFGIGIGIGILGILTNVLEVPNFAPFVAAMIGLGVGIDYALFIVTRYRGELHAGRDPRSATVTAIATSGRAVLFAGITVVISLLGIMVIGFTFLQGLAVSAAAAVLVTMLASVTFVPALLGFVRDRIDKFHVPAFHRQETAHRESFWYRWSHHVARRPAIYAVVGLTILVTLCLPVFKMRLGVADAGSDPRSTTARRAYDLLADGFGPGFSAPFVVGAIVDDPGDLTALGDFAERIKGEPGVASVSPVLPNSAGNAAIISVVPSTAPQDAATTALVHRLRQDAQSSLRDRGVTAYVGGLNAFNVDFTAQIADRLPLLLAVVIVLSFLLLMVVFRSLVVPVKAALMNLLSVGAAYGFVVAVFQWGWLSGVFGVEQPGPIESWVPMMLFAILFGLSMDYEVFLLSRIREEYDRNGGDNRAAVADGLAATARVITAAALIMICVFASFAFGGVRALKIMGLGLAVAILVDATIVRMVLVPATMELLGNANWWLPRWLRRVLPTVDIEGPASDEPALEHSG